MDGVLLLALAAFLVTAGLFLISLDCRDRPPPTQPLPLPYPEPGDLFRDPSDRLSR